MEEAEYARLAAAEDGLWWFKGLHGNLLAAWRPAAHATVLDAGCGTGGFLARLAAAAPEARLFGIDFHAGACAAARAKSGRAVAAARIEALPFADARFDAVFSADVLCHDGVAEGPALAALRRVLKPGGVLVLNLPAYRWLFSAHDRAVANARRYGRRELERSLAAAGFAAIRTRYWNSLLFPLMVARRKLGPRRGAASDVTPLPPLLERSFAACLAVEARLVAAGLALPFGGSILAIAVRP